MLKIECPKNCGSIFGEVVPSGPHKKIVCSGCGAYIKFASKKDLENDVVITSSQRNESKQATSAILEGFKGNPSKSITFDELKDLEFTHIAFENGTINVYANEYLVYSK